MGGGGYRESGRRGGGNLGCYGNGNKMAVCESVIFVLKFQCLFVFCFLFVVLLINLRALVHCDCFVFCVWHCFLKNVAVVVVLG